MSTNDEIEELKQRVASLDPQYWEASRLLRGLAKNGDAIADYSNV